MNIKKNNGFTLLEILVVVTIIGLLAAIGAVSYGALLKGSRNARRKADLEQIRAALEIYKSANNGYPSTAGAWWGPCTGANSKYGDAYVPGLAPTYINKLPHDPKEGDTVANPISVANCPASWNYCYVYRSDGIDYKLMANCGPESAVDTDDQYYDPRPRSWTYQVSSSGTSLGW